MKKIQLLITVFMISCASFVSKAQTADNYFIGSWGVLVKGTPNGDAVLPMRFEQKDGKIKGYVTNPQDKTESAMSSVEIKGNDLSAAFQLMSYDLTMTLSKKDDDHCKGSLMGMFDAEGTRVKTANTFLGKWETLIAGTPNGDVKFNANFEMKGDTLIGYSDKTETMDKIVFRNIVVKGPTISYEFTAQGYDLTMILTKKDEDNLEGKLMDMFDTKAKRVK